MKKVAIIGSGPAGLAAAYYLNLLGHSGAVFEALPEAGGMLRVGIPPFRLPRDVLDREIKQIEDVGVEIHTNHRIDSVGELFTSGFEAIFVSTGAHRSIRLGIPGEGSEGVVDGITFLRNLNLGYGVTLGKRVAVIGGGNVAIDSGRSALRLSARKVVIFYRRTREEMPAYEEEIEAALEEGVEIEYQVAPERIERINGRLEVEFIRMRTGDFGSSERKPLVPIERSEFKSEFDTVICAIGQRPEVPDDLKISFDGGLESRINPIQGVYLGGDLLTGPKTVVEAIASGRRGAILIDKFFGRKGDLDQVFAKKESAGQWPGSSSVDIDQNRTSMPVLGLRERASTFLEVNLGLDEQIAIAEAKRCLGCDLRFRIKRPALPPERLWALGEENIQSLPEAEGIYILFNEHKEVHQISGVENIRKALIEECEHKGAGRYFSYVEDRMFTSKERQLIQQYIKKHGSLPPGNREIDDLF